MRVLPGTHVRDVGPARGGRERATRTVRQISGTAVQGHLQPMQRVGLGLFLTVFQPRNRLPAQTGRLSQLAKTHADTLSRLPQTTKFQCHTSSSR